MYTEKLIQELRIKKHYNSVMLFYYCVVKKDKITLTVDNNKDKILVVGNIFIIKIFKIYKTVH